MLCQQEFSFSFMIDMISSLSIMILLVSLQSTNGIFMTWHYEEHRLRGGRLAIYRLTLSASICTVSAQEQMC